jgi:hypothetical protein
MDYSNLEEGSTPALKEVQEIIHNESKTFITVFGNIQIQLR